MCETVVLLLAPRPTGSGSPRASQVHFGRCNCRKPRGWTPWRGHQLCSRGVPSPTDTRLMLCTVGAAAASRQRLPPLLAPLDAATWCPARHGGAGTAAGAWFRLPEPAPASYFPFLCSKIPPRPVLEQVIVSEMTALQSNAPSPNLNKGSADFLPARLRNCFS